MLCELVRTQTSDGFRLDGCLERVSEQAMERIPTTDRLPLDAVICLSGVGSNFYGSTLIEDLASAFRVAGVATLRANTRGHDGVSTASTIRGGVLQGAAFERVEDCRYDLPAWVQLLGQRGFSRIGLLGHSLGGLKCLYSQTHAPDPRVNFVIAISPPCLSHELFWTGPDVDQFRESLTQAQGLVAAGENDVLFRATFPFPMAISAGTYLDKYGPGEKYNFFTWVERLTTSALFTFGELELTPSNVAFHNIVQRVEDVGWPKQRAKIAVIRRANHGYNGQHPALVDAIWRLLREAAV